MFVIGVVFVKIGERQLLVIERDSSMSAFPMIIDINESMMLNSRRLYPWDLN